MERSVYILKCNDCSKVYLCETCQKCEYRLTNHKRGEVNRTINSLYARL